MPSFSGIIKFDNKKSANLRLDRYISEVLGLFSRSQLKARKLKAKINGKDVKYSHHVKEGDSLELNWEDPVPVNLIAQDLPLEIVYEDDRCVVINKAQGMIVHPGAGNKQGTLANAIYYRILNKRKSGGIETVLVCDKTGAADSILSAAQTLPCIPAESSHRPGIVHRLDKDTSGVIIAAYDEDSHEFLANQFKNRLVKKTYIAIVQGGPKEQKGKIETNIARNPNDRKKFCVSAKGKTAVTFYKVISAGQNPAIGKYTLIKLRPRTGRTHQLRVHMQYLGCPILGDQLYGTNSKCGTKETLMLHAKKLEITLPGKDTPDIFTSPLPDRFWRIINAG